MTGAPPTIASLIASATEIVCALGLRDRLVAISHECDFPADVRGLPVLSAPKLDPSRPSGAIDQDVRALVREGLSVYRIDTEALARLAPALIVTQDQCEVCAVSLRDVEAACTVLAGRDVRVCTLRPHTLAGVRADFLRVGAAAGVAARAAALVAAFDARLAAVAARATGRAQPRVACLEWLDPPMVAGGWMPELVRIAGGTPVIVGGAGDRFATVAWDDVAAADPDVVVLLPCGYDLPRTLAELGDARLAAPLTALRAARTGRLFAADGNAYFNRPGPRLADSAELLGALLHLDPAAPAPPGAARWPARA